MAERGDIYSWVLSDKELAVLVPRQLQQSFQPKTFVRKRLQMTKSKENGGKRGETSWGHTVGIQLVFPDLRSHRLTTVQSEAYSSI